MIDRAVPKATTHEKMPPWRQRCLWLVLNLWLLAGAASAQTAPERPRPRPSTTPAIPAVPTQADKNANKRAAAQRAEEKRAADRRIAEAQAQIERERQARERLEADKRRLESQKAELDRRLKDEQARSTQAPVAVAAAVAVPAPAVAPVSRTPNAVARHPNGGQPLAARQIFVDSWGTETAWESAPRMVVVAPALAAGFLMGSPGEERGRDDDEKQHRVSISYAFALSETEVTFAHWDACIADGGCGNSRVNSGWGRGQHPVVHVNWHQARAYADWLNARLRLARDDPYRYRLPTEAEWEYAARANSSGPFGFAHNRGISPELANYDSRAAYLDGITRDWTQGTKPTGSYPASAFGLKDTHGNVWEWVADCYEPDYDKTPRDGSAHREHDGTCAYRVVRGGSWAFSPQDLRTANRFWALPGYRDNSGGFRLARRLPPAG